MMHQCGGSHGNMVGSSRSCSCSCGLFHNQTNSFSMFFSSSVPTHTPFMEDETTTMNMNGSSPSSSVDCTLSLGPPSTRLTELDHHHHSDDKKRSHVVARRSAGSYVSNFCWDLFHPKHSSHKNPGGRVAANGGGGGGGAVVSADPLLARRCANCDTTSTPLWRNGPRGPKSLCNACGIRFKKEERRASAAAATVNSTASVVTVESNHQMFGGGGGGGGGGNYTNSSSSPWIPQHSQTNQRIPCLSSAARFLEDDNRNESENGISFLSWRLNVTDRPSLVHDFTR